VTETLWRVGRVLSPAEATLLVGTDAPEGGAPVPGPRAYGDVTRVLDEANEETLALVTRLTPLALRKLREAVRSLPYQASSARIARTSNPSRTFGYTPRKPMGGQEGCHALSTTRDFPDQYGLLVELAARFGEEFRELMPERAVADEREVHRIRDDWLMHERGLWTSGVVNKTSRLPYHRDGANLDTWSVMPVVRFGVAGGGLRVPEYDMTFRCRDGDVVWFCGRRLVHGVTPMRARDPGAYRFSVVYYAMAGMVDCATYAEETRRGQVKRTERERDIARRLTAPAGS
jgi:hypothetical protein